jgi:hypothetical protein
MRSTPKNSPQPKEARAEEQLSKKTHRGGGRGEDRDRGQLSKKTHRGGGRGEDRDRGASVRSTTTNTSLEQPPMKRPQNPDPP